jgi:hypothetical protein
MASNQVVTGKTCKILVAQTALAMPGSAGAALGVFPSQRYSTFGGMVSGVGSLTLRTQFGIS